MQIKGALIGAGATLLVLAGGFTAIAVANADGRDDPAPSPSASATPVASETPTPTPTTTPTPTPEPAVTETAPAVQPEPTQPAAQPTTVQGPKSSQAPGKAGADLPAPPNVVIEPPAAPPDPKPMDPSMVTTATP